MPSLAIMGVTECVAVACEKAGLTIKRVRSQEERLSGVAVYPEGTPPESMESDLELLIRQFESGGVSPVCFILVGRRVDVLFRSWISAQQRESIENAVTEGLNASGITWKVTSGDATEEPQPYVLSQSEAPKRLIVLNSLAQKYRAALGVATRLATFIDGTMVLFAFPADLAQEDIQAQMRAKINEDQPLPPLATFSVGVFPPLRSELHGGYATVVREGIDPETHATIKRLAEGSLDISVEDRPN